MSVEEEQGTTIKLDKEEVEVYFISYDYIKHVSLQLVRAPNSKLSLS